MVIEIKPVRSGLVLVDGCFMNGCGGAAAPKWCDTAVTVQKANRDLGAGACFSFILNDYIGKAMWDLVVKVLCGYCSGFFRHESKQHVIWGYLNMLMWGSLMDAKILYKKFDLMYLCGKCKATYNGLKCTKKLTSIREIICANPLCWATPKSRIPMSLAHNKVLYDHEPFFVTFYFLFDCAWSVYAARQVLGYDDTRLAARLLLCLAREEPHFTAYVLISITHDLFTSEKYEYWLNFLYPFPVMEKDGWRHVVLTLIH